LLRDLKRRLSYSPSSDSREILKEILGLSLKKLLKLIKIIIKGKPEKDLG